MIVFLVGLTCICISSCKKDEIENPSSEECAQTTENPSFMNHIVPILELYCYSCHSDEHNQVLAEGIDLEGYLDVFPLAKNGKLVGSISHQEDCVPMPLGGSKIPPCDILKIERWVLQGAMNN